MECRRFLLATVVGLLLLSCGVRNPRHTRSNGDGLQMSQPTAADFSKEDLPTYYYTEGLRLATAENNYNGALELFHHALEIDSLYAPAYFEAANAYAQLDSIPQALEYSIRAHELDTANIWYKDLLGRLLIFAQRFSDALPLYEELVVDAPFNAENYRSLAALLYLDHQPSAAIALLDSAEYKFGPLDEFVILKRQLLIETGQIKRAIREAETYLLNNPFEIRPMLALADLYGYNGDDSLRRITLKRVLKLDSTNLPALLELSDFYRKHDNAPAFFATTKRIFATPQLNVEQKVEMFENITRDRDFYRQYYPQLNTIAANLILQYPDQWPAIELYGQHMILFGHIQQALDLFKAQLDKPELAAQAFPPVIEIENYLNHPDSVARYIDLALEMFPQNTSFLIQQAGILQQKQQTKEARKVLKTALETTDNDSVRSVVFGIMGDLYHLENNLRKTFAYYDKALALHYDNPLVLNNYAYFLSIEKRDLDRALEMAIRANELEENNSTYLDTYAWVLFQAGEVAEAKKVMQQALSLDRTDSPELLVHYGDILWALGDKFMASIYWKRAKEAGYDPEIIDAKLKLSESAAP